MEPRIVMTPPESIPPQPAPITTVVVVGLGNLGSQMIEALGRHPSIRRVVLVDPDTYAPSNLSGQQVLARELGRPKVLVQARRLAAIHPGLEVIPFVADIAEVPVGWLRGAVVLGGLDSLRARISLNEAIWRAGAIWIDGGVETDAGLARVSVFAPAPDAACFECGLEPTDYDQLPVRHLCAGATDDTTPTQGNLSLGALCAARMTLELHALEASDSTAASLRGRQWFLDARHDALFVSRLHRRADCRFSHPLSHAQPLRGVTERSRLREAFAAAQRQLDSTRPVRLALPGRVFARALRCPGGCPPAPVLAVASRLRTAQHRCRNCGQELTVAGFDCLDTLTASALTGRWLQRPLRALGLQAGDVLVAEDGEQTLPLEIPATPEGALVSALPDRGGLEK